jgi:hypothetical protein
MLGYGSEKEVGNSRATVATLFVIPEADSVNVQMKFYRLDGNRVSWRRPSAHRGCGGSMLRNGSYIGGCNQRLILQPDEEFRQHVDCDWGTQWRTSVCPSFGGSTLGMQQ